jgi:protoporphyrinogen oxidase
LAERISADKVQLGTSLDEVDPERRTVTIGGEARPYHALISSIPLPRLIERCAGAPAAVRDAARRLRATAVQYLDVASRTPPPADYHWVYVPEERLPFYRVGVYSNAMPSMAPPGGSSMYVELASREPVTDRQAMEREVLPALVEVGALRAVEDVEFVELRRIDPAYVVFDQHYEAALQVILPYLEEHRIFSRGRYGSWIYNAMEDSLLAGREAAARVAALAPDERAATA